MHVFFSPAIFVSTGLFFLSQCNTSQHTALQSAELPIHIPRIVFPSGEFLTGYSASPEVTAWGAKDPGGFISNPKPYFVPNRQYSAIEPMLKEMIRARLDETKSQRLVASQSCTAYYDHFGFNEYFQKPLCLQALAACMEYSAAKKLDVCNCHVYESVPVTCAEKLEDGFRSYCQS